MQNLFQYSTYTEKITKKEKRILFVGLLHPIKGLDYLFEALSKLKKTRDDFQLDVVGYGPYENKYRQLVEKLNLINKVKFYGMKTKNDVANFMQNCDFLVFPSLVIPNIWEGWGIVLIEAIACGKPVITTTSNCKPGDFIVTDYGVLVPPKDSEALLKAIKYMLDNFNKYPTEDMIKYVRKNFSYKAVGRLLHRIYVQVLRDYKRVK